MATSIAVILSQQQKNPDAQNAAMQLVSLLRDAMRDPSPPVQAWAGGTIARVAGPVDRPTAVNRLVSDPYWVSRMLGLAAMGPPMKLDEQMAIANPVAERDTDPVVLAYANPLVSLLKLAAAASTQPSATQPGGATQPTMPNPLIPPSQTGPAPVTVAPAAPTTQPGVSVTPAPINPTTPPTSRPVGELVVPSLPLTLPQATTQP